MKLEQVLTIVLVLSMAAAVLVAQAQNQKQRRRERALARHLEDLAARTAELLELRIAPDEPSRLSGRRDGFDVRVRWRSDGPDVGCDRAEVWLERVFEQGDREAPESWAVFLAPGGHPSAKLEPMLREGWRRIGRRWQRTIACEPEELWIAIERGIERAAATPRNDREMVARLVAVAERVPALRLKALMALLTHHAEDPAAKRALEVALAEPAPDKNPGGARQATKAIDAKLRARIAQRLSDAPPARLAREAEPEPVEAPPLMSPAPGLEWAGVRVPMLDDLDRAAS